MKCPHCGVHYMDGERECPVCGKKPGIFAPKKTSSYQTGENSYRSNASRKQQTVKTAKPRTAAEQAKVHEHMEYYSSDKPKPKKKKSGCGCLIAAIIILFAVLGALIPIVTTTVDYIADQLSASDSDVYDGDTYDSVTEYAELSSAIPVGTWVTEDGKMVLTVVDEDSAEWTIDGVSGSMEYGLCSLFLLTEENASTYCSDEELERYPLQEYTQYSVRLWDSETFEDAADWCIYREDALTEEDTLTIDYYNYDTGEYGVLYRADESGQPLVDDATETEETEDTEQDGQITAEPAKEESVEPDGALM